MLTAAATEGRAAAVQALLDTMYGAYLSGDRSGMDRLLSPELTMFDSASPHLITGFAQLDQLRRNRKADPDHGFEVRNLTVRDLRVRETGGVIVAAWWLRIDAVDAAGADVTPELCRNSAVLVDAQGGMQIEHLHEDVWQRLGEPVENETGVSLPEEEASGAGLDSAGSGAAEPRRSDPFPAEVFGARLERAQAKALEHGLSALIIGHGHDMRYLLGIEGDTFERLTALVVPARGQVTLLIPQLELAQVRGTAAEMLEVRVIGWTDGEDPYAAVGDAITGGDAAGAAASRPASGAAMRLGVSDELPALHTVPLAERLGAEIALATPAIRDDRMVKDAREIDELRFAGAAIDAVHRRVPGLLRAGRTEREVAADIEAAIVAEGHRNAEFVIVGSGPNGADPHHAVSGRVIEDGDIVVVDIGGASPQGYYSDCTRTYVLGDGDPTALQHIEALVRAQQAAVDAVRPGVTASQIDRAARDVLAEAGIADRFVHRTGHGIGVSVHEEPYISPDNELVVREGMTFSIEPGVYFAGEWGARIEDIVLVTENGCERLNRVPHGLTPAGEA